MGTRTHFGKDTLLSPPPFNWTHFIKQNGVGFDKYASDFVGVSSFRQYFYSAFSSRHVSLWLSLLFLYRRQTPTSPPNEITLTGRYRYGYLTFGNSAMYICTNEPQQYRPSPESVASCPSHQLLDRVYFRAAYQEKLLGANRRIPARNQFVDIAMYGVPKRCRSYRYKSQLWGHGIPQQWSHNTALASATLLQISSLTFSLARTSFVRVCGIHPRD